MALCSKCGKNEVGPNQICVRCECAGHSEKEAEKARRQERLLIASRILGGMYAAVIVDWGDRSRNECADAALAQADILIAKLND